VKAIMIIRGTSGHDFLFGTTEDDTIYGYAGDDALQGGDGDDHLWGGEGADVLDGGLGSDWAHYDDAKAGVYVRLDTGAGYTGAAAGDTLYSIEGLSGSSYNDILVGDAGLNWINGNGGDDLIFGLGGIDVLHGGNGNDQIWGGAARDYMYGDDGYDFVRYDDASTGVDVRLDEPSPFFGVGQGGGWSGVDAVDDALWSMEGLVGSHYADHLVGSDTAPGVNADNILFGLEGDDELIGKGGNDQLNGGEGADLLDGGTGYDTARYDDATAGVAVSLELGMGWAGEAYGDRLTGIEGLAGSRYDDALVGNFADNAISGGDGNDILMGVAGNDVLAGGRGADTLYGGTGNDQFYFERADLTDSHDAVMDFNVAAGDTDALVFHGVTLAELTMVDIGGGVKVSIGDPTLAGDITVYGVNAATLAGHLVFV
jgi:Ca2+-binding RTX toxin-like protein